MPVLQVLSTQPLSGKTAIACGLGQGFANQRLRVRLIRCGAGVAASEDALTFAEYLFSTSPGQPVAAAALPAAAANEVIVVEFDSATAPVVTAAAVIVMRGTPAQTDIELARSLGERLIGSVATGIAVPAIESVARDLTNAGLRPLAVVPEDRTLAAPSVDEIRLALNARVLYQSDNAREVVEDVLIAPVYADPARPHFRRFPHKAILAPYNKTDLHLAAIETQAACLVITGGGEPSPYVLDRAQREATTVLLAPSETPETVAALSDVWLTSRFRGERKAEAIAAHLRHFDFANLAKKLGV